MNLIYSLLIILLVESKYSDICTQYSETFTLKDIPNVKFCVDKRNNSNHEQTLNSQRMKAAYQELEQMTIQENPFEFNPNDVSLYINIHEIQNTGTLNEHTQNTTVTPHNQLRIMKEVYLKNIIGRDLIVTNIYSSSAVLKVDFEKNLRLQPKKKQKAFTIIFQQTLDDVPLGSYKLYLAIEIANQIKLPFQILVYDKYIMCSNGLTAGECNGDNLKIDLGNVARHEQKEMLLSLYNPNPIRIELRYQRMQSKFNHIESKFNKIKLIPIERESLKTANKTFFNLDIPPFAYFYFKAILNANKQGQGVGRFLLWTSYQWIEYEVKYNVIVGELLLYPSTLIFDPYLNIKQQFQVIGKSCFRENVNVSKIESKQLKSQNYSINIVNNEFSQNTKQLLMKVEYTPKSKAKKLNKNYIIQVKLDVGRIVEIPIIFKASNISAIQLNNNIYNNKKSYRNQQQGLGQINVYVAIMSVINIVYLCFKLRNEQKQSIINNSKFKIEVKDMMFKNIELNLLQLFSVKEILQDTIPTHQSEQVSEQIDEQVSEGRDDDVERESIESVRDAESVESSSNFSVGESVAFDQLSELTEVNHNRNEEIQQNKDYFDLFQKIKFSVPNAQTSHILSNQQKWNCKDAIFLPQDSGASDDDETELDEQKIEQLQTQFKSKLPSFEQSDLKFPFIYPSKPPGI